MDSYFFLVGQSLDGLIGFWKRGSLELPIFSLQLTPKIIITLKRFGIGAVDGAFLCMVRVWIWILNH